MCEVYASDTNGGGLIAIWDTRSFNALNKHMGNRWILLEGRINKHNFECYVGVIYGQNDRVGRYHLFEEIKQLVIAVNKPVLLLGDFNVILHKRERIGSFRCNLSMTEFAEWIVDLGLIDIPLHGIKFTWRRNESKSKIDRGLCCRSWLTKFPNMNLVGLKRSFYDHNPLLLSLEPSTNWAPNLLDAMMHGSQIRT